MKKIGSLILILFMLTPNLLAQDSISLIGQWIRMTPNGPMAFDFKSDGSIAVDMGNDGSVDVIAHYRIQNDTVYFEDKEGQMCQDNATYKVYQTDYYTSFDLIKDECNGRVKTTMGFWTKPDFSQLLQDLGNQITADPVDQAVYLNRARIYMALGKSNDAKADFDKYLAACPNDARALINRAGTRFPLDLTGVIADCSKALDIDPTNKKAWFLRGLAKYESGLEEEGCADFDAAIGYGFTILRIAEESRCAIYWKKE